MPIIRGSTSRGAHVRALWEALTALLDDLPELPNATRVRLRAQRALLEKAYPGELGVDISLAQALAEEDGDAVQE